MTDLEIRLDNEDQQIDGLIRVCLGSDDPDAYDDIDDLLDRKIALGKRFGLARELTWLAWWEAQRKAAAA